MIANANPLICLDENVTDAVDAIESLNDVISGVDTGLVLRTRLLVRDGR